jgi:hypothetical protein
MRLTGIDSLQRGLTNLLANWQLVIAHFAQTVLVSLLMVAGLVPLVLVVGVGSLRAFFGTGLDSGGPPLDVLDDLVSRMAESTGSLLLAILVALCVWTVALLVFAYFQAGIFGVLAGAERQSALPRAPREAFRSFSIAIFRHSADELTWRFFWLINLFMVIVSLPLAALGGVVMMTVWLATSESFWATFATGCLGGAVVALLAVATSLWWQLAMAAAASGPLGLWQAVGMGWSVLVRRVGAVLVLMLLAVVVGITAAVVFIPLGLVVEVAMRDSLWGYFVAQVAMTVCQSLFSAVVSVALAGSLVALVRGEISTRRMQVA